jgi:uncharacterized protein YebE (UPF0316 family)
MSWLAVESALWALLIFAIRMVNMSLDTLRLLMMMRGRKAVTWIFGFIQVLLFLYLIARVFQDINNILIVIAFCAGYATGTSLGLVFEERMALGHTDLRIVSPGRGVELAKHLRQQGYAVTEVAGKGKDGTVNLLYCSVHRKRFKEVTQLIEQIDPQAFVSAEQTQAMRGGFWGM